MTNPLKHFTKKEWLLWIVSLLVLLLSNLLSGEPDPVTLLAPCVGATSLIFAAKGNVWAQFLVMAFCILYGILSWRQQYWGEMITYLGMTLPMAVWSAVTWLRNPSENGSEVAIRQITGTHLAWLTVCSLIVTAVFYRILSALGTPNLAVSTLSVATSFLAASLTMLRSPYFAIAYAVNDLVLILLWGIASVEDPAYIPVTANFVIFFFNDLYGFVSWKKREKLQNAFP